MKHAKKPFIRTLVALVLACTTGIAWAQTASGATPTVGTAPATASKPTDKLVTTFSDFSGSPDNAASLVNGLRTGSAITLSSATGGSPGGEALTFSAPTRPMGYGNIRIAMSLAQAQLASQGITNPTPTQLQGALMGTTVVGSTGSTTTQGILQMRASGMGWGQIANSMGYKLGPVMSGKQTFTTATTSAAGTTTRAAGSTSVVHGKSGITTAGGGSINAGGHGKSQTVTAAGSHGKSQIVTAAGGGGGSGVSTGLGHGHAAGASSGVVSAAGGKAGAGGQGAAHGKGGGKP